MSIVIVFKCPILHKITAKCILNNKLEKLDKMLKEKHDV